MADTKKPLIYLIYSDLVGAVNGIGKKTYLDRPKSDYEKLQNFIVVDIPTAISGSIAGSFETMANSYGTYHVFCKSKDDATLNIGAQSELVQKILDKFPINGTYCSATKPTVLMQGEDGYGYHVTTITFKLRTKYNARNIQQ